MVAAKIPSLELIQIATPCTADWEAMSGDERTRFCSDCKLNVYNLSDMTRVEALEFMSQREGRTCIRMFKRADGTVITRDCPVGLRAVRVKLVRLALATAGMLLAIGFTALAALGKMPGAKTYLSQGKLERLRERYYPQVMQGGFVAMGGCPAPPITGVVAAPASAPMSPTLSPNQGATEEPPPAQ